MLNFQTALSGLRASQVAINVFSNNIANANTPGYSRQSIGLVDRVPISQQGLLLGTGVEVSRINRIASATIESAIVENASSIGASTVGIDIARQIESVISPGSGSIAEQLQNFFNSAQNVQSRPDSGVERAIFIESARSLAAEFNQASDSLTRLHLSTRNELDHAVSTVNEKLNLLFETNRQIAVAEARGLVPNDLYDRHQLQLEEVSELVEIRAQKTESGFDYQIANYSINQADVAIRAEFDNEGDLKFYTDGGFELRPSSGALAGFQEFLNSTLSNTQQDLNKLATVFAQQVDQVHATGLNGQGGFEFLKSSRPVTNVGLPLGDSVQPLSLAAGQLFVSVTDTNTGERVLNRVSIDPSQTLQDFADSISALDNIQAVINPSDSSVSIIAQPGFEFDFAGRLETNPDRTKITGDAVISISGQYTGSENDFFNYEVVGSGIVGVDDDLAVQVTRSNGDVVGTYNIGAGYEPGSPIKLADGVEIRFETGNLNDGDTFSTQLVQNADTAGILSALGINTLFTGNDAASIAVDPNILDDNGRLNLSRNGDSGDGENAGRLFRLREQLTLDNNRTFSQEITNIQTEVGLTVNSLSNQRGAQIQLQERLQGEREAISGVDQNEELVRMLQYQESFQASVRVISVIDQMMTELLQVVR